MNMLPSRDGYGQALLQMAEQGRDILAMDADVAKSTRTNWVAEKYPDKFLDMGIAEQDMIGTAAGVSMTGVVPFATTYCVFLIGRAFDQIRTTVCYGNLNVKLAGAHAGISVGPDGATHQSLEDVALMRTLPNMTVVVPCDAEETRKATLAIADAKGPCFIRFGREAVPVVTDAETPFELGKARLVRDGKHAVVFANGPMVYHAQRAAEQLQTAGIDLMVVDLHTVKPLDEEFVVAAAKKTGAVVTAEEHQKAGGMGGAVCECLAENFPVPVVRVAVDDSFGESGEPEALMKKYGLHTDDIVAAVKKATGLRR